MAVDQELSALATVASLLPTDIIYLVRDPGGVAEADNQAAVSVIDARYASAAQGALAATALQAAAIGVTVQAYDAGLSAITAFGRSLIDDVDAAAGRATLVAAGTGDANTFTQNQKIVKASGVATFGIDTGLTTAETFLMMFTNSSPTSGAAIIWGDSDNLATLRFGTSNDFATIGGFSEKARFTATGQLGIALTTVVDAATKLAVNGDVHLDGTGSAALRIDRGASGNAALMHFETAGTKLWGMGSGVGVDDFGWWENSNISLPRFVITKASRLTTMYGKVRVTQDSTTGAVPALQLNQSDLSEEFIRFESTVGAGNAIDTAALGAYYGKVRVYVEGVGAKWLALYN